MFYGRGPRHLEVWTAQNTVRNSGSKQPFSGDPLAESQAIQVQGYMLPRNERNVQPLPAFSRPTVASLCSPRAGSAIDGSVTASPVRRAVLKLD